MGEQVRCTNCKEIIESKHRHDFITCKCWDDKKKQGAFVDGGDDYCRFGGYTAELVAETNHK